MFYWIVLCLKVSLLLLWLSKKSPVSSHCDDDSDKVEDEEGGNDAGRW
jgi:hypothetical protein